MVTRGAALSAVSRASSSSARPSAASARRKARTIQTGCENSRPSRSSSERADSATRVIQSPACRARRAAARRWRTRGAAARRGAGEFDGFVDRRVRRDPGRQQLVHAEAQRVEHGRVDLGDGPIGGDRDDRVVGALPAQGAVGELGGEGGVGGVEPGALDRSRAAAGSRRRRIRARRGTSRTRRGAVARAAHDPATGASRCAAPATSRAAAIAPLPAGCTVRARSVPSRCRPAPRARAARGHPAARAGASRGGRGASSTLSRAPSMVVCAPGSGVTPRMRPSTASRGSSHRMRPSSRPSFGAKVGSPVCGDCDGGAVGDRVDDVERAGLRPRRRAREQRPRGRVVGRCGDLGEHVAGIELGDEVEDGRAGLGIARDQRVLDGRGPAPARQEREVQVDPAVRGGDSSGSRTRPP